ncbi:MarR family winged helix-turn-helix transcriptional regulator [Microbacterium sp.]|uniref:MarR family winged helix-turn-helix transcriptional regulator n=1 Tax=Microbacterium sp. TaxID=51671 RepID=UPI0027336277|nr:MarR family transcriptional regulator [Microbacterium sp.]MDP3953128.1 MarR family transcriptional regulator [Microbacterium sp.]
MQAVDPSADPDSVERIEQELTLLVRRAQKVHLRGGPAEHVVERAAYGILAWLHDTGPLRPSALAAHFHLDASTISRQVASLEQAGLITREPDAEDRRACRLRLTEHGQSVLTTTRAERRGVVRELLQSWSPGDLATFGSLLAAFNEGLDHHLAPDPHTPSPTAEESQP